MNIVTIAPDLWLMDREALATWLGRSVHTVRARCPVHSYDPVGRALYDAHACAALLDRIPQRARRAA